MKKISVFALAGVIAVPAFATDDNVQGNIEKTTTDALTQLTDTQNAVDATVQDVAVSADKVSETFSVQDETKSDPEIKFPHGLQIGVGASATSGVNGFVGYNNKKFDSFWWKRLGVSLHFATTKPIKSSID